MRIVVPLVVIGLFVVGAIVVPSLYDFDPLQTELVDRLKPPGSTLSDGSYAVFGTDQVGEDLFAQMMMGARVSLTVGVSTPLPWPECWGESSGCSPASPAARWMAS